jgi:hypothetical protein
MDNSYSEIASLAYEAYRALTVESAIAFDGPMYVDGDMLTIGRNQFVGY